MSKETELADSIVHRYLTLVRYQRHVSDLIRRTANISGRQAGLLLWLVGNGPRTVGQISQYLYVRDATTSSLLDRMERDGFVTRRRGSTDNRKVYVEPTERGREIALQLPMSMVTSLRARLPELPLAELEQIEAALQRLSAVAEVDESVLE
jgi:DNA-binding MarR family transcriptional regulator